MKHFVPPTSNSKPRGRGYPSSEAARVRETSILPGEAELIEAFLGTAIMELFNGCAEGTEAEGKCP